MIEEIRNLKKVELHLHLDGSVELDRISNITNKNIDALKEKMIAKDKCENLSEYLTKFDTPIECMQKKENLTLIAKDLVDYLEKENVIYFKNRFNE
jgi:adenosine deaminase